MLFCSTSNCLLVIEGLWSNYAFYCVCFRSAVMKAEDFDGHDFEDPYAVLGVSRDCKQRDLRKKYQQLARELHPDKNQGLGEDEMREKTRSFQNVEKAYRMIEDETERDVIDAKLAEEDLRQDWPVSDTLDLSEMEYSQTGECYSYQCRCGGAYVVSETDLHADCIVVCCSCCTLCIEVTVQS